MIKVKIKTTNKRFTIPVPYQIIKLICCVITSKKFTTFVNKAIANDGKNIRIPYIEKSMLSPLLNNLQNHKGLTIVQTKLKDGTEVKVNL